MGGMVSTDVMAGFDDLTLALLCLGIVALGFATPVSRWLGFPQRPLARASLRRLGAQFSALGLAMGFFWHILDPLVLPLVPRALWPLLAEVPLVAGLLAGVRVGVVLMRVMVQEVELLPVESAVARPLVLLLQIIVCMTAGILFLHLLGVYIETWLFSASVLGVGVMLAARETLANCIVFVVMLASPIFHVGERILIYPESLDTDHAVLGVVADIGLLHTRLRTADGVIAVANRHFGSSPVLVFD